MCNWFVSHFVDDVQNAHARPQSRSRISIHVPYLVRSPNRGDDPTEVVQSLGSLEGMKVGAFQVGEQFGNGVVFSYTGGPYDE